MKRFLVLLSLCSSSFAWCADQVESRAPWLNNLPRPTEAAAIAPQQPAMGSLRDFLMQPAQKAEWIDEAKERLQSKAPRSEASRSAPEQDFDIQVFISTGMPEGVLRQLFRQALAKDPKRIRFVVRGFEPQKVGALLSKLRHLLPDPYNDDVIVEVDPNAFRAYAVDAVPVYLVKDKAKDKWFEIRGTASLDLAQDFARRGGSYTAGDLYPIAEPDILAVIEERARKYDWEPAMKRAQARAAQNLRPTFDLPTSSRNATAYFTPTFTAPHDITSPGQNGRGEVLIARAGQTFALLDYTRLQVPVLVFDATDPRQLSLVRQWIQRPEYKGADVFVVGSNAVARDTTTPVSSDLQHLLKRPVFPMPRRLAERFGVDAVPAIVEQEGRNLRIRYFDAASGLAK
ncbi:TrbC family F-type conjugative pilus assembly protein [Delftia tsuruhatensis]|uniref:TrbC family F-type conjugative pilus assembly protein n=1 Tax=Delftia tsuruhatensis TaxID=180282 RepID=UPI002028B526